MCLVMTSSLAAKVGPQGTRHRKGRGSALPEAAVHDEARVARFQRPVVEAQHARVALRLCGATLTAISAVRESCEACARECGLHRSYLAWKLRPVAHDLAA